MDLAALNPFKPNIPTAAPVAAPTTTPPAIPTAAPGSPEPVSATPDAPVKPTPGAGFQLTGPDGKIVDLSTLAKIDDPKSGLDNFDFLLDNIETKSTSSTNTPNPILSSQVFSPEALKKITESLDFTTAITTESLEKLKSGDPTAIVAAMNDMAKQAYMTAMMHSSKVSDRALSSNLEASNSNINTIVNDAISNNQINSAIPGANNPLVQMGMKSISADIAKAHPNASPQDIAKLTVGYFQELAKAMNPDANPTPPKDPKDVQVEDWEEFATMANFEES